MTHDDIWWHFMTYDDIMVTFHDKTCRLSWYMTCHDNSWNNSVWFREEGSAQIMVYLQIEHCLHKMPIAFMWAYSKVCGVQVKDERCEVQRANLCWSMFNVACQLLEVHCIFVPLLSTLVKKINSSSFHLQILKYQMEYREAMAVNYTDQKKLLPIFF